MVKFVDGGFSSSEIDKIIGDATREIGEAKHIIETAKKSLGHINHCLNSDNESARQEDFFKNLYNLTRGIDSAYASKESSTQKELRELHNKIKKGSITRDPDEQIIRDLISQNMDFFAKAMFCKKGFSAWLRCSLDLRIYHKENYNYDYMINERIADLNNKSVPLDIMKVISQCYPEELMTRCVVLNNNITYHSFGFNTKTLIKVYTHYIKNRKRLLKGDIRVESLSNFSEDENQKKEHLKNLVKSFYK